MEYIIICIVAFLGSGLTLFSGFGLGTLLLPVFGIFFPIELSIALTAIVHFLNNLFKLTLVGKKAEKNDKCNIRNYVKWLTMRQIKCYVLQNTFSTLLPTTKAHKSCRK